MTLSEENEEIVSDDKQMEESFDLKQLLQSEGKSPEEIEEELPNLKKAWDYLIGHLEYMYSDRREHFATIDKSQIKNGEQTASSSKSVVKKRNMPPARTNDHTS